MHTNDCPPAAKNPELQVTAQLDPLESRYPPVVSVNELELSWQ